MNANLAAFKAQRDGSSAAPSSAAPATSSVAPAADPTANAISSSLSNYRTQRDSGTLPAAAPKGGNALIDFAKNIFEAPATIIARPFQAAADLGDYLGTKIEADKATSQGNTAAASAILAADAQREQKKQTESSFGGLVAPIPKNAADVKKDVGRAAETVALGTGAPLAGGALFGAGASLEQGNDLFSAQTAIDAALGAGGGKVLDWVGKPILNAAGKVIGTITPKIIKDVASGGADVIAKFAANNRLLGGIAAKPSALLAKGLQTVDDKIGAGTKAVFTGAKNVAKDQFPGLDATAHYQAVNKKDLLRPTEVNAPAYRKATAVFNDAKSRGIDLGDVAKQRNIIHDQIAEGGKYNTAETADALRDANYAVSDSIARPAIRAAQPGTRLVPTSEIRNAMLDHVHSLPNSSIDATDRAAIASQIAKRYAPGSAEDLAHPNGYSLEDLHDARITAQKNGKYKIGGTTSDALKAQRARQEGRVFDQVFTKTAPAELGIAPFKKELEKNFLLADYLEQLHGKAVPQGITAKAVRLFGRGLGGVLGSKIGGFPGFLVGSRGGDMLFDTFETLPNPLKMKVLQSVKTEDPQAFKELVKYIGTKESERLMTKGLPGPGGSSFKETPPTVYVTPKGKATTIKSEAADVAAVETGKAKAPKTNRSLKSYLNKVKYAQDAEGTYVPPDQLPVIKTGPKKKSTKRLNDIQL